MRARAAVVAALIAALALPSCGPRWYYEERPAPVPEMPAARSRLDASDAIRVAQASFPECSVAFARWVDSQTAELMVCEAPVGYRWVGGEPQRLAPGEHTSASVAPPPVYGSHPPSGGGDVHVRGYYRRDGTYVRPHTRHRPRR